MTSKPTELRLQMLGLGMGDCEHTSGLIRRILMLRGLPLVITPKTNDHKILLGKNEALELLD